MWLRRIQSLPPCHRPTRDADGARQQEIRGATLHCSSLAKKLLKTVAQVEVYRFTAARSVPRADKSESWEQGSCQEAPKVEKPVRSSNDQLPACR